MIGVAAAPSEQQGMNNPGRCKPEVAKFAAIISSDMAIGLTLVMLCYFCFANTLSCYFLNDDFACLRLMHSICQGQGDSFRQIWCTRLPQINPDLLIYRPLPYSYFCLAYGAFGPNALPYHMINILVHAGCTVALFQLMKQLGAQGARSGAKVRAFVAACLFATYPLHTEPVAWCGAMFDLMCAFFSLLTLLCFTRAMDQQIGKRAKLLTVSAFTFLLALLSKENAAVLPVVLVSYSVFGLKDGKPVDRIFQAVKSTAVFWMILIGFLSVRAAILGTAIGGYFGPGWDIFQLSFWQRWAVGNGLCQFWSPVYAHLFAPQDLRCKLVAVLCCTALGLYLVALTHKEGRSTTDTAGFAAQQKRVSLFLLSWLTISLIPITPVLMLGRQLYLPSVPLCMLVTAILLRDVGDMAGSLSQVRFGWNRLNAAMINSVVLIILSLLLGSLTVSNNQAWLDASAEVLQLKSQLSNALSRIPAADRLLLLNTPAYSTVVHTFYRSHVLESMMSAPFVSAKTLQNRIDVPDPRLLLFAGDAVSSKQLRLFCSSLDRLCYWDRNSDRIQLVNLDLSRQSCNSVLTRTATHRDQTGQVSYAEFTYAGVPVGSIDFVQMQLRCRRLKGADEHVLPSASLTWNSRGGRPFSAPERIYVPVTADGCWHTYHFPVSESKQWLCFKHTGLLRISLPSPYFVNEVLGVRVVDESALVPKLEMIGQQPLFASHYRRISALCHVALDATAVERSDHVIVELSKPDAVFDFASSPLRTGGGARYVAHRFIASKRGVLVLAPECFPKSGTYELRAVAVSAEGNHVSYYSDPVFIEVDANTARSQTTKANGIKSNEAGSNVTESNAAESNVLDSRLAHWNEVLSKAAASKLPQLSAARSEVPQ